MSPTSTRYLDGIERDDAGLVPVADDCVRIENGVPTTLQPGGEHAPRHPRLLGPPLQVHELSW
ncbi:MAG TPA: hypothetical protein VFD49_25565 [Candidatus Dormibacteraeota bacterium]|nr:hypothetical protein [Candidatus Dormibacteraeota bacterium]